MSSRAADASSKTTEVDLRVSPHQAQFLELDCTIGALFGGIGCGKTFIGAWWHVLKALRNPGSIGCVAGGVTRTLRETTLPAIRDVAERLGVEYVLGRDPQPIFGYESFFPGHQNILSWENGSQDMIWSLAAGERLRGPEISRGWVDELRLGDKHTWDVMLGRFRSEKNIDRPEIRVTSTPSGLDWMYSYFVKEPQDDAGCASERQYVHGRTYDNPWLGQWYVDMLLRSYDETYAKQELGGEFIDMGQGMCYYAFDREANISEKLPEWWAASNWWCVSFDFNVDPMACVILKHHKPTGSIYVFDELWLRDSNTPAMCERLAEWHAKRGEGKVVHIYGDSAGYGRQTAGGTDYMIIRKRFSQWPQRVPDANPGVRDRVNTVNGLLKPVKGPPRLLIHPRCHNLIEDLDMCQRDDGGHPMKYADDQDFERKKRTHPSDALGYFCAREYPVRFEFRPGKVA